MSQFVCYTPYGEAIMDEHLTTYENPFKFSGKELDNITGLYDHGARNRNPISTLWYGVDPLFEKYPDFSPYNYCAGNPVKLVDSTGCAGENTGGTPAKQQKDGTYTTAQSSTYVQPVKSEPTKSEPSWTEIVSNWYDRADISGALIATGNVVIGVSEVGTGAASPEAGVGVVLIADGLTRIATNVMKIGYSLSGDKKHQMLFLLIWEQFLEKVLMS